MKLARQGRSVNWRVLGAAAALGAAIVPNTQQGPVHAMTYRATPSLMRLATLHPHATFSVIVTKRGKTTTPEAIVRRAGGRVTQELPLINGFAARASAAAIRELAANHSVNWLSSNGPAVKTGTFTSATNLLQTYENSIQAAQAWSSYTGSGIGVAVVDSGVNGSLADFQNSDGSWRVIAQAKFNSNTNSMADMYGHGTHIAGIIAGNGAASNGGYVGVAPDANLINVKVSDGNGGANVSDVVNGLQWVYNNRSTYNIRVVNLSLNSTVADSYQVDPLDAAVETLWKGGIVVVVSAGNAGSTNAGALFAPANDPFAITVGAVDEHGTTSTSDDTVASFSSFGTITNVATLTGITTSINKPDLVAPGVNIISDLASSGTTLAKTHPANVVNSSYFMMSGTSVAAPMVTGAAALLLQAKPGLTPDQVKYTLMSTATPLVGVGTGAGEVNVAAAINTSATKSANQGLQVAASLLPGNPAANWGSASWGSAAWGSTDWSSAAWGSAAWGSVSWGSAAWGSATWGSDYWGP